MMRRPLAQAQLDTAVERSIVTLVRGLPRVGRSSLFADWLGRRTDARRADAAALAPEPGIFIVDHVDEASAQAIIAAVRIAEAAKSRTRFVIAPTDLRAAELLRTMLPGVVDVVEIAPLRPDEVADEASHELRAELAFTALGVGRHNGNLRVAHGGGAGNRAAVDVVIAGNHEDALDVAAAGGEVVDPGLGDVVFGRMAF